MFSTEAIAHCKSTHSPCDWLHYMTLTKYRALKTSGIAGFSRVLFLVIQTNSIFTSIVQCSNVIRLFLSAGGHMIRVHN